MKKVLSIIFVAVLLAVAILPVSATIDTDEFIFDFANCIDSTNEDTINYELAQINSSCDTAFAIVTMPTDSAITLDDYSDFFMENHTELNTGDPIALFVFDTVANDYDAVTYYYEDEEYIDQSTINTLIDICDEIVADFNYDDGILNLAGNIYAFMLYGNLIPEDISLDSEAAASTPDSQGKSVIDDAGLLTEDEITSLEEKIANVYNELSFTIVIHTCDTYGGKDVVSYADDYYDYNGYPNDGCVFVINMTERDYYTSTKGYGITALTDYAIGDENGTINREIQPLLSDGDYYEAFDTYIDRVGEYVKEAKTDAPYDTNHKVAIYWGDFWKVELVIIAIALVLALSFSKMKVDQLKTAKIATEAKSYEVPGSLNLTDARDVFVTTTISKTKKSTEQPRSGGGSSTHSSSSGSSHGGGGGKF